MNDTATAILDSNTLARGSEYLRASDARLGRWIDRVGVLRFRPERHRFATLCHSIVSQQLGSAAARTIYGRLCALFAPAPRPRPDVLLRLRVPALRSCGLSQRKVEFLRALAREFHDGALRRVRFAERSDGEVIDLLTRVPGIGDWTAEMFLIFSLGRPDVFSVGDLALRSGVQRVEGRELTPREISAVAARWAPYRSVASLYLWKVAHWREEAAS